MRRILTSWPISIPLFIWALVLLFYYEPLDEGFNEFYFPAVEAIPDSENIAVALAGLNAPQGMDFIAYGIEKVTAHRNDPMGDVDTASLAGGAPTLEFLGDTNKLSCWTSQQQLDTDSTSCASVAELNIFLADNAELLNRYWHITTLAHYRDISPYSGNLFISLNKLVNAQIKLHIQNHKYELAYSLWQDNYSFILLLLRSEVTVIDKAIGMVAHNLSLISLALLFNSHPYIVDIHGKELDLLIPPVGLEMFNLQGMFRAEFLMVQSLLLDKELNESRLDNNLIRNRYYRFMNEYITAANDTPTSAVSRINNLTEKYVPFRYLNSDYLTAPITAVLSDLMIRGFAKLGAMNEAMYYQIGKQRMLTLTIAIKRNHIPKDQLDSYVRNVDSSLKEPITGEPFFYNASLHTLEYGPPGHPQKFFISL